MMPEPVVPLKLGGAAAAAGGSQKKKGGQAAVPDRSVQDRSVQDRSVRSVNFNEEIEILTQAPVTAQQRRAVDYEPPASFIQNLDRPGPGRVQKEGVIKGNVLADLWTM